VRIDPDTGTRDYKTTSFVVWNVRAEDSGGLAFVPTLVYENGHWVPIAYNKFIYKSENLNHQQQKYTVCIKYTMQIRFNMPLQNFLGGIDPGYWLFDVFVFNGHIISRCRGDQTLRTISIDFGSLLIFSCS